MSNEALVRSSLQIKKGELDHSTRPSSFRADVAGDGGPTPGQITCTTTGTNVDLSVLATPGLCRIQNLDGTNFVTVGIWDPETEVFYPLLELLAGESYALRLSRDLAWEFATGTGTIGPETNTLRIKADTASCDVLVEAFEA